MSATTPLFSIIIPVYDNWTLLDLCLHSLAEETNAPGFEVIVVDDGSIEPAPEFIHSWSTAFPLTVVRQPHEGIAAARNRGVRIARGSVLLFIDADCEVLPDCLRALASTISDSPQHDCFQLHIIGDGSGLVGRSEDLRLNMLQAHLIQRDGCIRYLNTSGFAIRRAVVNIARGLFNPTVARAEDTLLLANLMAGGKLPLFVSSAIVRHTVPLSLFAYLQKVIRSAYLESKTFNIIASMGMKIRLSYWERLGMFSLMWKISGRHSIGRLACFVILGRTGLARMVSGVCASFQYWPYPRWDRRIVFPPFGQVSSRAIRTESSI